jgi:hypothetical protein
MGSETHSDECRRGLESDEIAIPRPSEIARPMMAYFLLSEVVGLAAIVGGGEPVGHRTVGRDAFSTGVQSQR